MKTTDKQAMTKEKKEKDAAILNYIIKKMSKSHIEKLKQYKN